MLPAFAQDGARITDTRLGGFAFPEASRSWTADPDQSKAATLDMAAAMVGRSCADREYHLWRAATETPDQIREKTDAAFVAEGWTLDTVSRSDDGARIHMAIRNGERLILAWQPDQGAMGLLLCAAAGISTPDTIAQVAPPDPVAREELTAALPEGAAPVGPPLAGLNFDLPAELAVTQADGAPAPDMPLPLPNPGRIAALQPGDLGGPADGAIDLTTTAAAVPTGPVETPLLVPIPLPFDVANPPAADAGVPPPGGAATRAFDRTATAIPPDDGLGMTPGPADAVAAAAPVELPTFVTQLAPPVASRPADPAQPAVAPATPDGIAALLQTVAPPPTTHMQPALAQGPVGAEVPAAVILSEESSGLLRSVLPVLIALGLAGLALLLLRRGMARDVHFAARWPRAIATVTGSQVELVPDIDSRGVEITRFRPWVRYAFEAGGERYEADQVRLGDPLEDDRAVAEDIVARYPENAGIEIRFDPLEPANAIIELPTRRPNWSLAAGALSGALALVVLVGGLVA